MRVRFNLKDAKAENSLIVLKIRYLYSEQLPLTFSVNESIQTRFWDASKMRAKTLKEFPQATWLNAKLARYENACLDYIRQHQVNQGKPPTHHQLKAYLNQLKAEFQGKQTATTTSAETFLSFSARFIQRMQNDPEFSEHTSKMFKVLLGNLDAFCKETRRKADFEAFDLDWFDDWQNWNFSKGKSKNTIAGYWKRFKRILNDAIEHGIYSGKDHKRRALAVSFQRADEVFLTPDELMKLYRLDLTGTALEKYRDVFLLDAFSAGFRFSDLTDLSAAKIIPINNVRTLKIHTKKTDTAVYAPGSWFLEEFLEKYKAGFPRKVSGQKFNQAIKQVCKLAGLTDVVDLRKNVGGKDIYVRKIKAECVTQYTARYSFATNLYLAGVDLKQISILLGHSTVKTTETYIKAKQLATVMAMANNPYFTTKPATAG